MFVSLLVFFDLLSENLLAFFAGHDQLGGGLKFVVLGVLVALGAVEPLLAAWSTEGDLGIENVFAHV